MAIRLFGCYYRDKCRSDISRAFVCFWEERQKVLEYLKDITS